MAENKVKHLGVIMDGNRRWARQHMLASVMRGHEKGVDTFMDLCTWCQDADIPYLSVYAFSTENWERSQEEVARYAEDVKNGICSPETLTEKDFGSYLDTKDVPDIDLVIRTGGNRRLSNFFPWQTVYSEIWFTDVLWPDFSKADMKKALDYYETIQINKGK